MNTGIVAKDALTARVGRSSISCEVKNKDMYGREVSKCNLPGTGDLGEWLVSKGYAVAYRLAYLNFDCLSLL